MGALEGSALGESASLAPNKHLTILCRQKNLILGVIDLVPWVWLSLVTIQLEI